MRKNLLLFLTPAVLLGALLLFSGSETLIDKQAAADFVGSDACKTCHSEKFTDWEASGHPYKFTITEGSTPPTYPAEAVNFQSQWMDSLGDGTHTWDDVAGVIGGYGWKARFVGTDGFIIGTAGSSFPDAGKGHNQFNFYGGEDHGWVDYDASKTTKIYNYGCFKCHTTGGDTVGTWLAGVDGLGNFSEGGIGCESCHGPGGDHIVNFPDGIDRVYEFAHKDNALGGLEIDGVVKVPDPNGNDITFLCGTCHNRDYKDPINSSKGFIKHHEQWDEFVASKHYANGMNCKTCHNPHKRTIWDGDGITKTCETCHGGVTHMNHTAGPTCVDCHMPFAAKSGTKRGASGYVGDVRSHLLSITVDTASMFTEDGAWVRDDAERAASLSPAYSCLGCHNDDPADGIPDKTLEAAVAGAKNMHVATSVHRINDMLTGVYPNPSNGPTMISFKLEREATVELALYNMSAQLIYSTTVDKPAGAHTIYWDGNSNTGIEIYSGYYMLKLTAGQTSSTKKLVIIK